MEVVTGEIISADPEGLTIRVPYGNWQRFTRRDYREAQVGLMDGRKISPEQRRKAYALLGEIAAWTGFTPDEMKLAAKQEFMENHLQGLQKKLFSLADCDMTTAREFITYLINFVITFGVPCSRPLVELCEDVQQYVYACATHKVCAVCGQKADLHHVDRVGMGRNRNKILHIGLECLPLCRLHHQQVDELGDDAFMQAYHLETVTIDQTIAKANNLRGKKAP